MKAHRRTADLPKIFVASERQCATPKSRRMGGAGMSDQKSQVFESPALKQASDRAAEQRGSLREALSSISDKSTGSKPSDFPSNSSKAKVAAQGG